MRWGLGPVFLYECLTSSRRWQTYALRSLGVAVLLFAMGSIAFSRNAVNRGSSVRDYADLGESYFFAMIGVELALVILAAPAATAGSICVDRARGTLAHMLMTDLSDPEIVLGKLAARLLPVFGLVACTWPVLAISSLLGGIDPIALSLAFAIILAVAVLGCTTALALSVWARKSHEVILATYTVWILGALIWPIWYFLSTFGRVGPPAEWTLLANPFYVAFAPYARPGKLGFSDYLVFFGVVLGVSAVLTILAVWRTRPVACGGSVEKRRGPRIGLMGRIARSLPGPSLDRNPVLWREWHRSRPSVWMMVLLALLMGTTGVLCLTGAVALWINGAIPRPGAVSAWGVAGIFSYLLHVSFGLLMLSAVAPTSMAEERQRGSLDILAATTLSTRAIVVGKWLGTFRLVALTCLAPGVLALAMATARSKPAFVPAGVGLPPEYYQEVLLGARIYGVFVLVATLLAHGALLTSIGLALAVWIKQQSRAIATSVGLFVLIAAGWPIFVSITMNHSQNFGRDVASLSPLVVCGAFINFFTSRTYGFAGYILCAGTFWAIEVLVLALGLLWLTVRTFDQSFDRLSDRPSRIPVRTIVVMILAGMIGAGSLVGAIAAWIEGVTLDGSRSTVILAYCFFLTVGLVLIVLVSERSVSAGRPTQTSASDTAAGLTAGRFIASRWWESFRLVLLLAIGPAILAMALATPHVPPRYVSKITTDPSGSQVVTYVRVDEPSERAGEVPLSLRLIGVALLVVTVLVHGAGAVGMGLAFAVARGWTRRALGVGFGLSLVVGFFLPLDRSVLYRGLMLDIVNWSFNTAAKSLFETLVDRGSFNLLDTIWPVVFWDVVVAFVALGLFWWTSRAWQRQSVGIPKAKLSFATNGEEDRPAVEAALVGD